ncbi:DUF6009 family protein [Streptomyces sp. NBC_00209]|uniref:DUF6009 family protein n=1 Tax=Streptomyces sp. NBC_00209 TaxID=2975682 RepID=UPI003244FB38
MLREDQQALRHEEEIVWTEDVTEFDYVRQTVHHMASTRRRPLAWTGTGRRVGYSVLNADTPSGEETGKFVRRIFWVKPHDRSEDPDGTYKVSAPSEAIDPRTVAPGIWGELTERAWGGPFPSGG